MIELDPQVHQDTLASLAERRAAAEQRIMGAASNITNQMLLDIFMAGYRQALSDNSLLKAGD